MLMIAEIKTENYKEFPSPLTPHEKVATFMKGLKVIIETYKFPREKLHKSTFKTLEEVIAKTEPLRTGYGQFEADSAILKHLIQQMVTNTNSLSIKAVPNIDYRVKEEGGHFETYDALIQAQDYAHQRGCFKNRHRRYSSHGNLHARSDQLSFRHSKCGFDVTIHR
ncbi:MAG TPA: hypothetical protein PKE69_28300, partial [Pyrinomonadaceae bacterium]|nr:hypothetical protein [Pyrinomonadaceae bacterium]